MKPRVFISSTFYDLKYIREDLSNFIKAHDFEPIMFEEGDIGYTPGKPLDESCYKTMHSADMVLLIIGGNYGSPATGEIKDSFGEYMSVTRNEFKVAVEEGIPIYVFIDTKVYVEYEVYEANVGSIEDQKNNINFRNVKDINVFRFIKEIKNIGNIAITEFDKTSQIKDFLSRQWSDMFKKYLDSLQNMRMEKKLENTILQMKILMKQMNLMLVNIGKKIFDKDDNKCYLHMVSEMDIENICGILSEYTYTSEFVKNSKEENIRRYLEGIIEFLNLQKVRSFDSEYWSNYFLNIMSEKGSSSCQIITDIKDYFDVLYTLFDNEVYKKVQEKLIEDKYYNKIFFI